MTFKFTLVSDEVEDFVRIIKINCQDSFFDFHNAILEAVGYTKDQITSFFTCSENWDREQQISLIEIDLGAEYDNLLMQDTLLEELLEDEKQKLIYVFDIISDRAFFIELSEIVTGENIDEPVCILSEGKAPKQIVMEDIASVITAPVKSSIDEDFFREEYIDDTFDEDDLGDIIISEGEPFEGDY